MKKNLIALFLLGYLLCGCALGLGTIKYSTNNPQFQYENLPIREIRIIAVVDEAAPGLDEIRKHVEEVSQALKEQVGITLKIVSWRGIHYKHSNVEERAYEISDKLIKKSQDYDIAIGFGGFSLFVNLVGGAPGAIEDSYRRHIALKGLDEIITMHEILHAFILDHGHSVTGIMQMVQVKIIPFTPSINMCSYLSPSDRKEVLRNKWRDFSKRVGIE